ncbi:MAG: glutathione-dependent disulfide-bond oxidoreductase [Rhodobacteraceae bacterium]|nr:glutathione-dependent disulfide-bond oxidoreductase [Paracoccaceae bacterium]
MTETAAYVPPKVWIWDKENGGQFAGTNRPISGVTHEAPLPRGEHAFQLYSMATPNGVKVTMMFEELLEAGHSGAEYDAWLIRIGAGDQFGSGFTEINPNQKIPALVDYTGTHPLRVFESGSILLHLAEKFEAFLPASGPERTEVINWLMWQMGSAPFLGGGFGHFYAYAPEKYEYPINRYAMETKRQLDVLDKQLALHPYVAGEDYSIADMAIWPWYGGVVLNRAYNAAEFLDAASYTHVMAWAKKIDARPAVIRARKVNRNWGEAQDQLPERHSAADFDRL